MSKDTRTDLVAELEKFPTSPGIAAIIADAKAGEFHDYKNQKYVCGKIELVTQLRAEGLNALAQSVIDGEYDETADAEDIAEMRRTLPPSMWPVFGLEPK